MATKKKAAKKKAARAAAPKKKAARTAAPKKKVAGSAKQGRPATKKAAVKKAAVKGRKTTALQGAEQREQEARKLSLAIAAAGLEHKALNIEIIDVRGKVDYADYVIVMSGTSDRHVNALARRIDETLRDKHEQRCAAIEGTPHGTWLLMDYGDVIVHIFHEDTRGYYDLENLWLDAARVPPTS